jgi:hypothetical protein
MLATNLAERVLTWWLAAGAWQGQTARPPMPVAAGVRPAAHPATPSAPVHTHAHQPRISFSVRAPS